MMDWLADRRWSWWTPLGKLVDTFPALPSGKLRRRARMNNGLAGRDGLWPPSARKLRGSIRGVVSSNFGKALPLTSDARSFRFVAQCAILLRRRFTGRPGHASKPHSTRLRMSRAFPPGLRPGFPSAGGQFSFLDLRADCDMLRQPCIQRRADEQI